MWFILTNVNYSCKYHCKGYLTNYNTLQLEDINKTGQITFHLYQDIFFQIRTSFFISFFSRCGMVLSLNHQVIDESCILYSFIYNTFHRGSNIQFLYSSYISESNFSKICLKYWHIRHCIYVNEYVVKISLYPTQLFMLFFLYHLFF